VSVVAVTSAAGAVSTTAKFSSFMVFR
jgi:hypothetical protein